MTDYDLPPDENYGMPEFDMPEEHVKWFTDRGWKHEERPDYTMYSKMSPTGIRHSVYWDGRRAWDRNEPVYQLESTIPSKQDSSGTRTVQSEPNAIFESSDPQAIADKARQNEQAWMTGEHNSVRNPGLLKFMEDPGHQEYDKRFWDEPVEEFPAGKIGDKEFVEPKEKLHPYWRGGPEGRSGLGKLNAAQTPGQRGAEEFLNSPDYWNLVNQGTHPEHRDTEAEFPYYEEDYDVYPGHDEAGPSHDLRAHDRSEHDYEDEPRHEEPEPEYVEGPQNDYERELHQQLGQAGFTYRRDGEYGKTDEHGNWHTVMMPGDYRRARSLTTEFYNPRTEQTITHSGHNNHDSVLDRLDINHEYSKAQAANPNADYKTHFLNWVRRNPESYTAQEYRRMSRWGYVDPVKSHFPWAELQGLSPEQSAFQRTHPKVRRQILDGLRGNIDYKTWQNLVQIHNIQARVDRLRSQQGRPSPYRHPNAPQPVHNPRDITMELPRVAAAAIPDESTLKAAGIAVIAMDTGRVLMQQRALNPIMCPCGMGVTWDEMNGYQHDDGSVSHDGEFYGQSVSDLLDQGHPMESDNEEEDLEDDDGIDKTAALEFDPNEGTWEFPGGKLDEGESARAAAIREFREEVGQEIPPGVFVGAWVSPGGIVVAASTTKVAVQPGDPSYGFQGSGHTAPTRGEEGNKNTLDNMDDIMPDYLEHPEYYGSGYRGDLAEMEAHSKARRARGNPDKKVWIYRAVPHGISKIYGNTELSHMFPDKDPTDLAEWVTTSKTYAQQHANSESCPKCKGKMQIVAARARAGDLVNEGYPTEFGYVGDATLEHVGANRIYKTKCPAPRKTEEQRNQEYLDSLDENDHPTAETYKIIRGSSVHQASDWEQFDKNPDYRWGHTDGARGDQQRYDELSAKLDMGMGLEPAEADYLEGHIHGTEGARENARATHNIMKLWRDAPDYPQKEAAAKGPVYKGFIYLIQKESDIDLGNREIANPDDPDGDMSEQSAWWEIDHAKKNPALRKEVKSSTPWDELELWADRSVRANKEIKKAFNILAAAQTPAQLAAQKWLDENPGEFTYWNGSPDSSTGRFDIGSGEPPPDVDYEESRRRSNALAEQHGFRYIEPSNATMRGFFYRDSPTKPGMGQRLTEPSGWTPYWQVHQGPARNYGHSDYSVGMHQNLEDALANADYQDSRVAHEAASLEPEDIRTYNPEDRIKGITTEDRVRPGDPAAGESWWEHVPVKREAAVDRPDERPKLPEGLVYHDISEQPWQHFKDDGEETKFWRWRDRYLVPPLDEANPQHYQLGQGDTHHRSVDWQPMIMEKPQTDYTDEEHFDRAYSGPKTSVKWDEPICEDCYLRYGSTVPAGSHAFAMQRYWDDLGEKKHEFKPMMPDVDEHGNLKESSTKTAMPLTQDEPAVNGIEGSGEGSLNRKVTLPSGEWLAKSPQYSHLGEYEDPEDQEYFKQRANEDVNMEEFASRLGRALSDPNDEPITPEVVRGNKASDPGPTAYVRRYPEYRDMENGWLDHDDLEHHAHSPRGKVMGYFHSVLSDGDHTDHHNMLLLGDPMEESSEKIQRMPTVSIDHTHSSLPAYAEALASGDPHEIRAMTWHHQGELSPYEEAHFLGTNAAGWPTRKRSNPLHPNDTARALAASETMRPWAQERGVEPWLDAAQKRMKLLGKSASGTESMFPYKMHHELGQQHVAASQRPSVPTFMRLKNLIGLNRPEFSMRTDEDIPSKQHNLILSSEHPQYHDEANYQPGSPKIYGLRSGMRHTFLAPVTHRETGEVGWLRGGDYADPESWTFYREDQLPNAIRGVRPGAVTRDPDAPAPADLRYKRQRATGKKPEIWQEGDRPLDEEGHQVAHHRPDPFGELARMRGWADDQSEFRLGSSQTPWWVYA